MQPKSVFTCVEFLICLGDGDGFVTLAGRGGLFSLLGLDPGNTLAATGWFFFPEGSSLAPSAGRFIPAMPPTERRRKRITQEKTDNNVD